MKKYISGNLYLHGDETLCNASGICEPLPLERQHIVIIDESALFRKIADRKLEHAGFCKRELHATIDACAQRTREPCIDLLIVEVETDSEQKFRFLSEIDRNNVKMVVPLAHRIHIESLERAVRIGVDDFLIKTRHLDIIKEIRALLKRRPQKNRFLCDSPQLFQSGFLRCVGLSDFERLLLEAFCPSFPSQKELAYLLEKSDGYIRKTFSNIYRKFNVVNIAQLAQILTICCLFGGINRTKA